MFRRSWLRIVIGLLLLGPAAFDLATRWEVLWAGQLAFPIVLCAVALAGLLVAASGLRRRERHRSIGRFIGALLGLVAAAAIAAGAIYLRPVPANDPVAMTSLADGDVSVAYSGDRIVLRPKQGAKRVMVFYPGARIDPRAYVRILGKLAATGVEVRIVKEPFNIAFLASGAAGKDLANLPKGTRGVVAGHSLGGVVAAADASRVDADLVLWASYPATSIKDSGRKVASIYGTKDELARPGDVKGAAYNLPDDTRFIEIEGANHGSFGDFAPLAGDGTEARPHAELETDIVRATAEFLSSLG